MNERERIVLKAFLSKCPPEQRAALERFLPVEEREKLQILPECTTEGFSNDILEQVHWSWFLPTLKTFSAREQQLFLAALDVTTARALAKALGISEHREPITEVAKAYFRSQLLSSLVGPHERLLPTAYLPPSTLNKLLQLSKKELIQLIDRLSLFDLAAELKHIVDTKTLKRISQCLTAEQISTLKMIPIPKDPHPLPRMGLDQWDGSEETLRSLLHRRGLARLGLALSGQDSDLIWMLCHLLDIGRGGTLFKLCGSTPIPELSALARNQVEELCG